MSVIVVELRYIISMARKVLKAIMTSMVSKGTLTKKTAVELRDQYRDKVA